MLATDSPLLPVYAQLPVHPVRAQGSWLYDAAGERWLDAYGGHAVASTGHCHPKVVAAIADQAARLCFILTVLPHPAREDLAAALVARCPAGLRKVFLVNSGAEANENALHLARKLTGRSRFVSIAGGWHGRTAQLWRSPTAKSTWPGPRRAGLPLSLRCRGTIPRRFSAVDDSIAGVIQSRCRA